MLLPHYVIACVYVGREREWCCLDELHSVVSLLIYLLSNLDQIKIRQHGLMMVKMGSIYVELVFLSHKSSFDQQKWLKRIE